jgi:hypothetical protein
MKTPPNPTRFAPRSRRRSCLEKDEVRELGCECRDRFRAHLVLRDLRELIEGRRPSAREHLAQSVSDFSLGKRRASAGKW